MSTFPRFQHGGGAIITTLAAPMGSGDTSGTITAATGWPDGSVGPFWVVIDPGLAGEEKVLVTSRSTTSLSGLTRGADGTSAAAHAAGAVIQHIFSATEADDANNAAHQLLGALTTKGDIAPATAANTVGRLAAGADGTFLTAQSGQSTGLQWATTPILKTIGTQLGSLIGFTGSGTPAEVQVGTNLYPLVANSGATNGVDYERLTPVGMGIVPFCRLYDGTPPTATNNATTTFSSWDTELADTNTMHDPTTNPGRITFQTAGIYEIAGCVRLQSNGVTAVGLLATLSVRVNGATTVVAASEGFATDGVNSVVTLNVKVSRVFSVNDYVELQVAQWSGASIVPTIASEWSPTFSACWTGNAA